MQTKKSSEISNQEFQTYTGIVLYVNGTKEYFLNGKHHRTDGPAIERSDGSKAWYFYDRLHRTDGPAVEQPDGYKAWWYHGKYIDVKSQKEFESWLKVAAFYD